MSVYHTVCTVASSVHYYTVGSVVDGQAVAQIMARQYTRHTQIATNPSVNTKLSSKYNTARIQQDKQFTDDSIPSINHLGQLQHQTS
jgi:hypothetical protein